MKNKDRLKIILPISIVCFAATVAVSLAIVLPRVNNRDNYAFFELKDDEVISLISDSGGNYTGGMELDELWQRYSDYKDNHVDDIHFFYETHLLSSSNYTCYYLSKTTIAKIDEANRKENIDYMTYDDGTINYLRYFQKLFEEGKLQNSDKIMTININVDNPSIKKVIKNYVLVKITRNIEVTNKDLGNYFIENVQYKEEGSSVLICEQALSFSEKYNDKDIIVYDVPHLKTIYKYNIFPAYSLDKTTYIINNSDMTFEAYIAYNRSIIENNEHYYDDLNGIIIEKQFIMEKPIYDDDNILFWLDCYKVVCDYNNAKTLFNF